jgi:hypothetical protein
MGVVHVGDPVAKGFVDGVLEDGRAVVNGYHFGPQTLHPEDIGPLSFHIYRSHINGAAKTELGRHSGCGHAVLTGSGFGDDPGLAHTSDQKALPHDIIGLMGAGMIQVFPFDVDAGPAEMTGEVFGKG